HGSGGNAPHHQGCGQRAGSTPWSRAKSLIFASGLVFQASGSVREGGSWMKPISRRFVVLLLAILGCGSDSPPGAETGAVRPCDEGQPSFDVWRAEFAPNQRTRITAQVDTRSSSTAAEFRLVVACQGEIVAEAID